jgi:uncharacterized protein (DUF1697 family)
MPVFVALLRAVNVGGTGIVPMAALKELFDKQGFKDARTLLQSGNVVFRAARATPAALAKKLEAAIRKRFGHDVRVIVRTPDELRDVVARDPFPVAARDDPSHLLVTFLAEAPTAAAAKALGQWKHATEPHKVVGRELYIHYKSGVGTSKFAGATIEKLLATAGTARNWNTINKLIALADDLERQ